MTQSNKQRLLLMIALAMTPVLHAKEISIFGLELGKPFSHDLVTIKSVKNTKSENQYIVTPPAPMAFFSDYSVQTTREQDHIAMISAIVDKKFKPDDAPKICKKLENSFGMPSLMKGGNCFWVFRANTRLTGVKADHALSVIFHGALEHIDIADQLVIFKTSVPYAVLTVIDLREIRKSMAAQHIDVKQLSRRSPKQRERR